MPGMKVVKLYRHILLIRQGLCSVQIQRLLKPLQAIEMPLVRVLASMESLGIAIDEEALTREMCAYPASKHHA